MGSNEDKGIYQEETQTKRWKIFQTRIKESTKERTSGRQKKNFGQVQIEIHIFRPLFQVPRPKVRLGEGS